MELSVTRRNCGPHKWTHLSIWSIYTNLPYCIHTSTGRYNFLQSAANYYRLDSKILWYIIFFYYPLLGSPPLTLPSLAPSFHFSLEFRRISSLFLFRGKILPFLRFPFAESEKGRQRKPVHTRNYVGPTKGAQVEDCWQTTRTDCKSLLSVNLRSACRIVRFTIAVDNYLLIGHWPASIVDKQRVCRTCEGRTNGDYWCTTKAGRKSLHNYGGLQSTGGL